MNSPDKDAIERILSARHSPDVHNLLRNSKIGIAGLGGLGSNIAVMLVRAGIGNIVIADHDIVDLSNINRQNYYLDQLGKRKTDATEELLKRINPYISITKHHLKLNSNNIPEIYKECDVVCEAFDIPSEKAMFINTILEKCPAIKIVSGSGMAGYGMSNEITTRKIFSSLYMCGDGKDMSEMKGGLMSPRVNICAGHMANAVLSILLKGEF